MPPLVQQRCFHHAHRPASARCPKCGRYFCRECVTEHGGRVVCAGCLRKQVEDKPQRSPWPSRLGLGIGVAAAFLVLWVAFSALGGYLLTLPSQFHQGVFGP